MLWYDAVGMKSRRAPQIETFFRALADRTRLRLLNLMGDEEVCVCFFVEIIGPNQPNISRHLAYLRRAGIVEARRDGKWMHYRIVEPDHPTLQALFRDVRTAIRSDPEMVKDRKQLSGLCCRPRIPAHLADAPKPQSVALTAL
jgi:ArsR family transcriptional regulator, arsenate/arsenite/antimonite-responsive transcriptional repressor